MLCLPECFAFIGASSGEGLKIAEPVTGPLISRYRELAKKHNIWLSLGGFQEASDKPTHVYNAHLVVDSKGELVANYRKIHLFDVEVPGGASFKESNYTIPGDKVVTCDSPIGTLGLSVCYDMRFPELYQALAARGAQVMLVPAAFTLKTGLAHWHALLRARAIETQSYVIAAAQHGQHNAGKTIVLDDGKADDGKSNSGSGEKKAAPGPLRESYGHAVCIDPWGTVVAEVSDGTGLAFAEIDLDKVASIRAAMPVTNHHRPDILPTPFAAAAKASS